MGNALLVVDRLRIEVRKQGGVIPLVKGSSFDIQHNEVVGVVGESGSGKSITSLAIMGLLDTNVMHCSGKVLFDGVNLLESSEQEMQKIRGAQIAMIFQEPMSALNPSEKCGKQVAEIIKQHYGQITRKELRQKVCELFHLVKLPGVEELFEKYPHEISGGQKQRVMIAMAIACQPKLLIADEPTTALDVTVQKDILLLLKEIQQKTGMSILFITHDLGVVSALADRVLVMHEGEIVEQGTRLQIFTNPQEIYTKALIASRPPVGERLRRLATIDDFIKGVSKDQRIDQASREKRHRQLYESEPLLSVEGITKDYVSSGLFKKKRFRALSDVSFSLYAGETLGLVGESGCGKSTLASVLMRLQSAQEGQVFYKGKDLLKMSAKEFLTYRREIQMIFQDPFSSLNPRICVGDAILEPMKYYKIGKDHQERKEKVLAILRDVGLSESSYDKYPHEFSGGQRQRIGIARSIALQPSIIICDESVSALDISVQAQVLNLLNDLKEQYGFTYLFISHDLAVVRYMSDHVLVMNKGKVEEYAEADLLYTSPKTEYTKKLIASMLSV